MAREHGRLLVRIWRDQLWLERNRDEQWLYEALIAQADVNNAGVLALRPRRWARLAQGTTEEEVRKALDGLADTRFVVVDEITEELLIRSFVRNDGVAKQPNVLISACRQALQVESETIRAALAEELTRVLAGGVKGDAAPVVRETIAELSREPTANPSTENPSPETPPETPPENPSTEPSPDNPSVENPSPNATRSRGVGRGVGEGGKSPSGEISLGGEHGDAKLAAAESRPSASGGPPPPTPSQDLPSPTPGGRWPTQRCGRRHDPDRDCRRCGELRRAEQDTADQAVLAEATRRAKARQRIESCTACDENGWLEHPETGAPVTRCDHRSDPRRQLADALDQPS